MRKGTKGIAVLLFAILLQLCSTGLEFIVLPVGLIGLVMALGSRE